MSKFIKNQRVNAILGVLKPWLLGVALLLVLRYTGALAGISFLTQSAVIETGIMDFNPAGNEAVAASFDYNFTLKDLKGNVVDVNQFKGKVLFINLWATWCGPCRVEMPSIQQLYNDLDHDKIVFIMLSLDTEENHPKVARYVQDKELTFPVYVPNGSVPRQLRVSSIPTTFIIDTEGKVRTKKTGTANYDTEEMREFLNGLTR